jgi:hypothetical protein
MQAGSDAGAKKDGWFFSPDRVLRLGPIRGVYFFTCAVLYVLTELGRKVYRPYIYRNGINDYGFADVVGNLLGTAVSIYLNLGVSHANRTQGFRIIAFTTIGITAYELLQPVLPRGVLDWKDVISTPVSGLFSTLIFMVIWRLVDDPLSKEHSSTQEQE